MTYIFRNFSAVQTKKALFICFNPQQMFIFLENETHSQKVRKSMQEKNFAANSPLPNFVGQIANKIVCFFLHNTRLELWEKINKSSKKN